MVSLMQKALILEQYIGYYKNLEYVLKITSLFPTY